MRTDTHVVRPRQAGGVLRRVPWDRGGGAQGHRKRSRTRPAERNRSRERSPESEKEERDAAESKHKKRNREKERGETRPRSRSRKRSAGRVRSDSQNNEPKMYPDDDHYDTAEEYGMKLPRRITKSMWSEERGTSLSDPLQAKVVEYLYKGKHDYALRLLANGEFLIFEACRSLPEHLFVTSMLKMARDRNSPVSLSLGGLVKTVGQKKEIAQREYSREARSLCRDCEGTREEADGNAGIRM